MIEQSEGYESSFAALPYKRKSRPYFKRNESYREPYRCNHKQMSLADRTFCQAKNNHDKKNELKSAAHQIITTIVLNPSLLWLRFYRNG